jgi:hypothetical protein
MIFALILMSFSPKSRHRPVFDRLGRRQRAQEIAEIIGERMKLEADGVGAERPI